MTGAQMILGEWESPIGIPSEFNQWQKIETETSPSQGFLPPSAQRDETQIEAQPQSQSVASPQWLAAFTKFSENFSPFCSSQSWWTDRSMCPLTIAPQQSIVRSRLFFLSPILGWRATSVNRSDAVALRTDMPRQPSIPHAAMDQWR